MEEVRWPIQTTNPWCCCCCYTCCCVLQTLSFSFSFSFSFPSPIFLPLPFPFLFFTLFPSRLPASLCFLPDHFLFFYFWANRGPHNSHSTTWLTPHSGALLWVNWPGNTCFFFLNVFFQKPRRASWWVGTCGPRFGPNKLFAYELGLEILMVICQLPTHLKGTYTYTYTHTLCIRISSTENYSQLDSAPWDMLETACIPGFMMSSLISQGRACFAKCDIFLPWSPCPSKTLAKPWCTCKFSSPAHTFCKPPSFREHVTCKVLVAPVMARPFPLPSIWKRLVICS